MDKNISDKALLNDGNKMPWLGFGVFLQKEGKELNDSIRWAVEAGYRAVDTAMGYFNEEGVGEALRACGVPREEVFITTKLWNADHGYENAIRACEASLKRLKMDYADLYLIHWPGMDQKLRLETWEALIKLKEKGLAKSIGVSNFEIGHIEELKAKMGVLPAVDQVELHPWMQQKELLRYARQNGITLTAWGPLMHGRIKELPEVAAIGRKFGKSASQTILRWDIQKGVMVIPKSVKKQRIIENASIFDFELTGEDMALIDSLDRKERLGPDSNKFFNIGFNND